MKTSRLFRLTALVLVLAALAACNRQPASTLKTSSRGGGARGETIVDFTLPSPDGSPLSAMSLAAQNKVTILDFWASWCGPCRREMPFMLRLYDAYRDKGLGIVGISLDESGVQWQNAIAELQLPWPQMSDLKGWHSQAAQAFHVTAIPFTVVLDSKGVVLKKGLRGEELEQFIDKLLK